MEEVDSDNNGLLKGNVPIARLPPGGPSSRRQKKPVEGGPIAQICAETPGLCAALLTLCSVILIITTLPFSLWLTIRVVQEYERAVIFRLGRLLSGGAKGPGVFFIIPCIDIYQKIDMRTASYEIPPQEILTKDSVTVFVNAIMYYHVKDPIKAVSEVDDYTGSARLLAATTLRNVLGTIYSLGKRWNCPSLAGAAPRGHGPLGCGGGEGGGEGCASARAADESHGCRSRGC